MSVNSILNTLTAFLLTATMASPIHAADLVIKVATIKEAKGKIMLAIYNSESSYRKTPVTGATDTAVTGEMEFSFSDLPAGAYAVLVYHDENDNEELDSNLMGMPKEPWGASLQGKKVFGAPGWGDTQFSLTDSGMSVSITLN